jgi:hypothetical protein
MNIWVVVGLIPASVVIALIIKSAVINKGIQVLDTKKSSDQSDLSKLQAQESGLKTQAEAQQDNATQEQKDAFWENENKK